MSDEEEIKPTVLMVDDRAENLLALRATLNVLDINLIEASSGEEALGFLLEHDVAIVLLDIQMPEMDGYEVAKLMRDTPSTALIPIIFLTAIASSDFNLEQAYLSGGVDFISKPVNVDILLAKIQIFIDMWSKTHELKEMTEKYQQLLAQVSQHRDELKELSIKDSLTGLYQRRVFDDLIIKEISRNTRHKTHFSIAMLDLDHFKQVNDNYGHVVGDEVLIKAANVIQDLMRTDDLVCRFGGEEFIILMPHTSLDDAKIIAERIRSNIEKTIFSTANGNLKVTISIGLHECCKQGISTSQEVVKEADACLYQAKNNGRNQIYPKLDSTK